MSVAKKGGGGHTPPPRPLPLVATCLLFLGKFLPVEFYIVLSFNNMTTIYFRTETATNWCRIMLCIFTVCTETDVHKPMKNIVFACGNVNISMEKE